MGTEDFFEKMMDEEYPEAGRLRYWWEEKKFNIWLKLKSGIGNETNEDFVKQIPS